MIIVMCWNLMLMKISIWSDTHDLPVSQVTPIDLGECSVHEAGHAKAFLETGLSS